MLPRRLLFGLFGVPFGDFQIAAPALVGYAVVMPLCPAGTAVAAVIAAWEMGLFSPPLAVNQAACRWALNWPGHQKRPWLVSSPRGQRGQVSTLCQACTARK